MLSDKEMSGIISVVDSFWTKFLSDTNNNKDFYTKAIGKEGGHQLGDKVDDLSTSKIHTEFPLQSGFQHKEGKRSPRSMGDIWIKNAASEWNPINVKTGLVGSEGQPNIVSLKRVITAIIEHSIDSYYLLLVKFVVDKDTKKISHTVHLTDMLDWLAMPKKDRVITWNSGPGQTMLKAAKFMQLLDDGYSPNKIHIRHKLMLLMELLEDGDKKLMLDREKVRNKIKKSYDGFVREETPFAISKDAQKKFEIQ